VRTSIGAIEKHGQIWISLLGNANIQVEGGFAFLRQSASKCTVTLPTYRIFLKIYPSNFIEILGIGDIVGNL
jgi:hypothetical protein